MSRILLDSDVIIWCLRGRPDVLSKVALWAADAVPACSALSVLEIEVGMKRGEETPTRGFLSAMVVEPVDGAVASQAAAFIRDFRRKGTTLDFVDAAVAATCLLKGYPLATFNHRHYPMTGISFAI